MATNSNGGLFPHFLGVLSKTPANAHKGSAADPSAPVPHPFNPNVPPVARHPHNPKATHPPVNKSYGGKIFIEGVRDRSTPEDREMDDLAEARKKVPYRPQVLI